MKNPRIKNLRFDLTTSEVKRYTLDAVAEGTEAMHNWLHDDSTDGPNEPLTLGQIIENIPRRFGIDQVVDALLSLTYEGYLVKAGYNGWILDEEVFQQKLLDAEVDILRVDRNYFSQVPLSTYELIESVA